VSNPRLSVMRFRIVVNVVELVRLYSNLPELLDDLARLVNKAA
jgi:hypothetical protein